ncbi:MAG: hypothetical protein U0165_12675 [Polyangiaceae bacterium]
MTPLDRLLAFRTLRIELVLIVLALIVGAATDEASASWADRATRLAAMTPILAAASVGIVLAQLRRRGELEALTLAGASPARVALGALVSAVLTAQLGALTSAAGLPLRSLFPASRAAQVGFVRRTPSCSPRKGWQYPTQARLRLARRSFTPS